MRALQTLAGLGLLTWFAGCNAILGNESEYTLASAGTANETGGAGADSGGSSGKGGSGGKAGAAGKGGSSGRTGAGGGSGKGGATNEGGGGSDAGESGAAGETGQAGTDAGAGGEGGQPACDPTGVEDCFNGRDDDCNTLTDCADPACDDSIARCVPIPDDAELGAMNVVGCDSSTQEITLYSGLSGPSECEGCSCQPATSRCDSGVYAYGPYTCGQFQFDGPLRNLFSDSCTQLTSDPNIHYYSIRGLSTCNAVGTAVPPPVAWTESANFCAWPKLGGGCGEGYRCAPVPEVPECLLLPGLNRDCTAEFPNPVAGDWHDGYHDDRECSQCQCAFGISECAGGTIQIFNDPSCATNPVNLGAAEGSACPLPFAPASGKISGTPATNTCPLQVYPSGSFEPTGPRTVCCQ